MNSFNEMYWFSRSCIVVYKTYSGLRFHCKFMFLYCRTWNVFRYKGVNDIQIVILEEGRIHIFWNNYVLSKMPSALLYFLKTSSFWKGILFLSTFMTSHFMSFQINNGYITLVLITTFSWLLTFISIMIVTVIRLLSLYLRVFIP